MPHRRLWKQARKSDESNGRTCGVAWLYHSKHDSRECFEKDTASMTQSARDDSTRLACACAALLFACSSTPPASARDVADANDTGRLLVGKSASDRALLEQLSGLPSGTPQRVGSATVVAESPYAAASGRSCRALHLTAASTKSPINRLACSDGRSWFFVPDVFGDDGSAE